jgi:hypothetical protein
MGLLLVLSVNLQQKTIILCTQLPNGIFELKKRGYMELELTDQK